MSRCNSPYCLIRFTAPPSIATSQKSQGPSLGTDQSYKHQACAKSSGRQAEKKNDRPPGHTRPTCAHTPSLTRKTFGRNDSATRNHADFLARKAVLLDLEIVKRRQSPSRPSQLTPAGIRGQQKEDSGGGRQIATRCVARFSIRNTSQKTNPAVLRQDVRALLLNEIHRLNLRSCESITRRS